MRVPRSQRGGEVVEPLVRKQWFVRMKPLAEPALKVSPVAQLHAPGGFQQWLHASREGLAALHAHLGNNACIPWAAGSLAGGLLLPPAGHAGASYLCLLQLAVWSWSCLLHSAVRGGVLPEPHCSI